MAVLKPSYEPVERGIQKVTRHYTDKPDVVTHRIKYADDKGNIHFKTVRSHRIKDARDALALARASVGRGEHIGPKAGRIRFKEVADQWYAVREGDWKERTARSVRWTIDKKLAALHDMRMCDVDYDAVTKFKKDELSRRDDGRKAAPSSIKRSLWVLNAICEHARKRKLIVTNPCQDLPKIKRDKGGRPKATMPDTEEVERLIIELARPTPARLDKRGRRLQERPADPRWPLLVETAAYTGLRAGELAGLKVRDLDFASGTIGVERTIITVCGSDIEREEARLREDTPKSEAGLRTVKHIDPAVMDRLQVHCRGMRRGDYVFGYVDANGRSRPMHHGNVYRRFIKPAADELGIEMTFHGLRHHSASLWISIGLNPVEVAANLGHHSAAFTYKTYAHQFKAQAPDRGDLVAERRAAARGETEVATGNVTRLRKGGAPF